MVDITKLRIGNYILHGENKDEAVLVKITLEIFSDIANNPSLYFHAPITEDFLLSRQFRIARDILGRKKGYIYDGSFGRRCRTILLLDYPPYFFLFINFDGNFYPKKKKGLENTYIPIIYIDRLQNAINILSGGDELL